MTKGSNMPLEDRLLAELKNEFFEMRNTAELLLRDIRYTKLGPLCDNLVKHLEPVKISVEQGISYLENVNTSQSHSVRTAMHDLNNYLTGPLGRTEILLGDRRYQSALGEGYYELSSALNRIKQAAARAAQLVTSIGGFYRAKEQNVELVEPLKLASEDTICTIVHIDDDAELRNTVADILATDTNTIKIPGDSNNYKGIFGHEGKRVKYKVYSFGSVTDALNGMKKIPKIDLMITDREMPQFNGFHLLYAISQLPDSNKRMPEYGHVQNTAMLTAGITEREAQFAKTTYGTTVFDKSIVAKPLALEQNIYSAISQKAP